jgi:hypothetical protein
VKCLLHKHSSEASSYRCAQKQSLRKLRRRNKLLFENKLERYARAPLKHVVVRHSPPRQAQRGGVTLLVWSEAISIRY